MKLREEYEQQRKGGVKAMVSAGAFLALVCFGVLFGLSGLTKIEPGEVGILVKLIGSDRGMQEETMDTGFRWVNPITYDVEIYDVRFKQYDMLKTTAETKDGQPILLDLSFEIGLADGKVPQLHETVGKGWYKEVVFPRARTSIRNATSAQVSEDIYTAEGRAAIRELVQSDMDSLMDRGFIITTNVRNLQFANSAFVATLERKAQADQLEEIERREAKAAEQAAIKVANVAEGAKQKVIKEAEASNARRILEAEAQREELRLEGEGLRLKQEEEAKGILAIAQAQAEGTRLQVNAYGKGETYASVKWAEHLGPNVKVYGIPTGSPGTTNLMDLNGIVSGAFKGATK